MYQHNTIPLKFQNEIYAAMAKTNANGQNIETKAWDTLAQRWSGSKYYIHHSIKPLAREIGITAIEKMALHALQGKSKRKDARSRRFAQALVNDNTLSAAKLLASVYRSAVRNTVLADAVALYAGCEELQQYGEDEEDTDLLPPLIFAIESGAPLGAIAARKGAQIVLCGNEFLEKKPKKVIKKTRKKSTTTNIKFIQKCLLEVENGC